LEGVAKRIDEALVVFRRVVEVRGCMNPIVSIVHDDSFVAEDLDNRWGIVYKIDKSLSGPDRHSN